MMCNSLNKDHICEKDKFSSCLHSYEFDIGDVVEFVIIDEGFTFHSNQLIILVLGYYIVI